ncbi:hypothetical protein SAMN06296386_10268 [Lachnospiraceae bacterium]|nr:hypothetical protein SAMN06296386_10268 [Lachnospiraceae bacterium]
MTKSIIKAAVFIVVFVASIFIISAIMNRGTTDMTVKMDEASYPVVSMKYYDREINMMHGYGNTEMKPETLRDSLTPLNDDRSADIIINTYGQKIASIAYEVRSADAKRLVENTEVTDYVQRSDTMITANLAIKDLIQDNTEYILAVVLTDVKGHELRYFTRIIHDSRLHGKELLKFVTDFSKKTFDKTQARSITTYLESDSTGDNSSFAKVNIHSSFDQITWGNLGFTAPETVKTKILEMDDTTATISLSYILNRTDSGTNRFYDVTEIYRVRYTDRRIYLLNFERTMEQVFDPDASGIFAADKIMLGVTDPDVNMVENEDGKVVAFVQNGALYAYRNTDSRAVRIFSFFTKGDDDERNRFEDHGIRILQVDEAGNVHFIVYGYMNRGRHEGQVGVSVYYYNSALNQIEEEVYIPYVKSYNYLKCEIEKLSYSHGGNELYLFLDGKILRVHLDTQGAETVAKNINYDELVVSESSRMAGWQSADHKTVQLCDFNTGEIREISKGENTEVRPLGFIGEDLVYGIADPSDTVNSSIGVVLRPMHTICIENSNGEVLKTYNRDGVYITDVSFEDNEIVLNRIQMAHGSGTFVSMAPDQIVNNISDTGDRNSITVAATEEYENIVEIALAGRINKNNVHVLTPEEVLYEGGRELALEETEDEQEIYLVYANGNITGIYDMVYEAVDRADSEGGVVLDMDQHYIWQKGNRATVREISGLAADTAGDTASSLSICLNALLKHEGVSVDVSSLLNSGMGAMDVIDNEIEDAKALNLGGCSLSSVLYYVSVGRPVLAEVETGKVVLIVGYDAKNTVIMDPETGTTYKKGMNDSKEWFENHGNEFVSYIMK